MALGPALTEAADRLVSTITLQPYGCVCRYCLTRRRIGGCHLVIDDDKSTAILARRRYGEPARTIAAGAKSPLLIRGVEADYGTL